GIDNIIIEKAKISESRMFPKDLPQELKDFFLKQIKEGDEMINFRPIHRKLCENGAFEETKFDLTDESEGTQKLFYLSGPIIDTLIGGKVLFIDEIEARLHPLLTRKLISLFHSKELNPHHAQLIFATHDTNLLSNKLFRRDQIWFVEKDEEGASHLYSLAELKVRNDASFGSEYLQGRYGAIPIFGEFKETLMDLEREDHQDEA
ncbi:MAG TPA: ATP-binding protein, partial [Flexilinea sp.]|nr:ATP-binding protein [Flexilinea sp.]